ncbi:sugar ABC transporter permease [Oscillospiraceae bacterium HV4-5-C5C]|nr:sugar ABC transporter permease [Oscillospiraceae bacterium HV4-5-C5C]
MKQEKRATAFAYSMGLPALVVLVGLSVFPLLYILIYSFTDYTLLAREAPAWVGWANYTEILQDPYFQQALLNTIKFAFLAVLLETGLGLLMALQVIRMPSGQRLLRTLLLLPVLLPGVTVALTWQTMFSNNDGILNQLLAWFGLPAVNWLQDPGTAFYAILAIDAWQYAPFAFLLIYAALQTVPASQYEAAQLDGAGSWARFRYITLPNIQSAILLTALLRMIDSFRLFDKVNILTRGGPANTTATITQYIYQNGVRSLKIGYGGAASVLMTLLVLLLSLTYIRRMFPASGRGAGHRRRVKQGRAWRLLERDRQVRRETKP